MLVGAPRCVFGLWEACREWGSEWPLILVVELWTTTGRAQVGYVTVLMLSRPRDIMLVQSAVIGAARHPLAPCWDSVRTVSNLLLRAPSAT